MFEALVAARNVIVHVREPLERIAKRDPDLAKQLRRAATSVPFNTGEGRMRKGADQLHLYRVAHGSAAEVIEALHVAVNWGYVEADEVAEAFAVLDSVCAMLWKLTH